jgi:hypothetical protein
VVGLETVNDDNGKIRQLRTDASFRKHADAMRCNAHDAMMKYNKQINLTVTTKNNWKASGASVSGCYNSPPLTRDLAPRSRNEKRKRKR